MKRQTKKTLKQMNQQAELYRLAQAAMLVHGGVVRLDEADKIIPIRPQVVLYARVSGTKLARPMDSLGYQLAECREFVTRLKSQVTREFKDFADGRSGGPELGQILALAEANPRAFDVVVTDLSRLSRNPLRVKAIVERLGRYGIGVHPVSLHRPEAGGSHER